MKIKYKNIMSGSTAGTIYGIIAAVSYGLNPLFALPLYDIGMDTDSILFYRYAFGVAILAVMLKLQGHSLALKRKEIFPLAVIGLLFAASSLFLFQSFHYMEAGLACTILFVYPIMVAIIMFLFFHERTSWLTAICILLAISGIALIYRPGNGTTLNATGLLLVILSSLFYSVYIVGINKSALQSLPIGKLTFYALLFGLSIFAVRLNGLTELQSIPSVEAWTNVISLALFPTVMSLVCITAAIHRIGPTTTAVLGALEPVTALIIGIAVFNETLTPRITLGVAMVITAVTLIVTGNSIQRWVRRALFNRL